MKFRVLSSGLTFGLLLFCCITTFVASERRQQITLNNWVDLSEGRWPKDDSNGNEAPFLVSYSENDGEKLVGFKDSYYNPNGNWLTNPDVSFRYWASDQTYLRARKTPRDLPEKDIPLSHNDDWVSSFDLNKDYKTSLKSISKNTWETLEFVSSATVSTLALKDVSVKYVEKITIDSNNPDPLTAYIAEALKIVNFTDTTPQPNTNPKVFKINNTLLNQYSKVKGIIRKSEIMPTDANAAKDICYEISKKDTIITRQEASSIDVYLTLENALIGFKLDTINNVASKKICLFDYVALQKFNKYMITLIVRGDLSAEFTITMKTSFEGTNQKSLSAPMGSVKLDSPSWFYYSSLFDVALNTDDIKPELYACDIISSCYPFTLSEDLDKTFVLTKEVKNELAKSPFFQIRGTVNPSTIAVTFATSPNDQSKKAFNKEFIGGENTQFLTEKSIKNANEKPTDLKYDLKFSEDDNKATITVSLDTIDMRFQELSMQIKLFNVDKHGVEKQFHRETDKSRIIFHSVDLKKGTESGQYTFPPKEFESVKFPFDTFTISSSELFFVRPTQKTTGNWAKITLELQPEIDGSGNPKQVVVKMLFDVKDLSERLPKINAATGDLKVLNPPAHGDIILKSNKNQFLVTDFIENTFQNTKLATSNLKFKFTVENNPDITPKKYAVYRVILDDGYPKYDNVSGTLNSNVVTFNDVVKAETEVKGPFRVLYIIRSKDTAVATIKNVFFEVKSKITVTSDLNTKMAHSVAHVNQDYEKAVCVYENDPKNTNICPLTEFYRLTEDYCDMSVGCSNILDKQLPTSVRPPYENPEKMFAPFQLGAPKKGQEFNLKISRKQTTDSSKPDFCIPFTYSANVTALKATVDGQSLNAINYPVTPNEAEVLTKVCASWFTNDVENVETIVFTFVNQEIDIDNHYVRFEDSKKLTIPSQYPNSNKLALNSGIYIDNRENDLFFENPEFHWTLVVNNTKLKNSLIYTVSKSKLVSFVGFPNSKKEKIPLYYETLRSRWIKIPKEDAQLTVGGKYMKDISDKQQIVQTFNARVISSLGKEEIIDMSKEFTVLSESKFGEYYQFQIDVVLNLDAVAKLDKENKLDDLILQIDQFSINDPCVNNKNKVQDCNSNNGDKYHNHCERLYNVNDYRPQCKCTKFFTGDFCEKDDFCKLDNKKTCGEFNCKNDYIFKKVECECATNKTWNPFFERCIDPKELICEDNKQPKYNHVSKKMECVCQEDFFKVTTGATTTCVAFNVCDPKHRASKSYPQATCRYSNATCVATGTKTNADDFQCDCAQGFTNKHDVHTKDAECLPDAICKDCQNRCIKTGKTYECKDKSCDPIGFKFNDKTNQCDFDPKLYAKNFGCNSLKQTEPTAEMKDGKPVCLCAEGQGLDELSQKCSSEKCDEKAMAACKERDASDCSFVTGKAVCKCKETDIPYATENKNASDWKCISKCSLLALPDYYDARCTNSFESCKEDKENPLIPIPLKSGLPATLPARNEPFIENVFVKGVTKVMVPTTGPKPYCVCDLGFVRDDDDKCVPSTTPTHTISGFEFDLISTQNLNNYLETVRKAFKKIIATILRIGKNHPDTPMTDDQLYDATKCEKATDTTILCSSSFQTDLNDTQITDMLNKACVKVGEDKNKCYYIIDDTQFYDSLSRFPRSINKFANFAAPSFLNTDILIHDVKTVPKVEVEDFCKKPDICAKFAYSVCTHDKDNVKPFECLCPKNKKFFKTIAVERLQINVKNQPDKVDLQLETCGTVNLCNDPSVKDTFGCKSNDAHCHFQVEFDEVKKDYIGLSYCTCPNSNITLSNRDLSCNKTCDGICNSKNSDSCAQDYITKKVVCHCKEGFSGTKCEKKLADVKKEAEATSSKAYLISTIVVSVIAAIALIGLAVLYFRRQKIPRRASYIVQH